MPGESFENREDPKDNIDAELVDLARRVERDSVGAENFEYVYAERTLEFKDGSQILIKTLFKKGDDGSLKDAQARAVDIQKKIEGKPSEYPYRDMIVHAKRDKRVSLVEDSQMAGRYFLVTKKGIFEYIP